MMEFNKVSGVYKISNNINDSVYIGGTENLQRRKSEHKNRLKRGVHRNSNLQDFYNKYGLDSLIFEVLEYCKEDLLKWEQFYMEKYPNKFNIDLIAESRLGAILSQETKDKISIAHKGKVHSKETRAKLSKASLGKAKSKKHRANISKGQIGRVHSKESVLKSAKMKYKSVNQYDLEGNFIATFESMTKCGESLGIFATHISSVCKGKAKTSGGFKFQYV